MGKPDAAADKTQVMPLILPEVFPPETVVSPDSFSKSPKASLVLEIFAGTCRLSKACRDVGLRATAVDKDRNRSEQFKILECDLTDSSELHRLEQYIASEGDDMLHAHFAPSCGTCSRAREIPIPHVPWDQQPKPLRSTEYPDGLPSLNTREAERVKQANDSYAAMVRLILLLISMRISVSIENPKNSILWLCSMMLALFDKVAGFTTVFHNCMHGGTRDKATAWWSFNPRSPTVNLFESLGLTCDRSHVHAPWRPTFDNKRQKFPTADEAAYPHVLCQRVAYILKQEAIKHGFISSETLEEQIQHDDSAGKRQLFASQSRQQRLRPLVSEFSQYCHFVCSPTQVDALELALKQHPRGTRVCHRQIFPGGIERDDLMKRFDQCTFDVNWESGWPCEVVQLGIPREPQDFLKEAVNKGHPRDLIARVPDVALEAVDSLVNQPTSKRFQDRATFFKKWLTRAMELKNDEAALHASMPKHLQKNLAGKKLLVLKEILTDLGYPDSEVVEDVIKGFSLTGWAPKTGVFHKSVRKPDFTVDQLMKMSPGLNAAVTKSLAGEGPSEHDEYVWRETLQEVERGWLVEAGHDPMECIAKRFPLPQKSKVRLIDDFTICGINATYGLTEKLRVQSVDELCAFLATMVDQDMGTSKPVLVGRTYDLKSAYKQYGVDEKHHHLLKIGVKRPGGGYGLFKVAALPFGATGSVTAFLRISNALAFIFLVGLKVVTTAFFDDYTVICDQTEVQNVDFYISGLFRLLGVWFAQEGDKAPEYAQQFKSLGVVFDVSQISHGAFQICHTETRLTELCETIDALLARDKCAPKELERLHGRLVWFGSFVFGRTMNSLVKEVSKLCRSRSKFLDIDLGLRSTLSELRVSLRNAKPVTIGRNLCNTWYVFTDGAYEPNDARPASVGGVLVSPTGSVTSFFGEEVSGSLLNELLKCSKHPIYELELLPVLLALQTWIIMLTGAQVVFYIDNEAARSAFIKCHGATANASLIVKFFADLEVSSRIFPWFGRVPSHSNLSDGPSRLCFDSKLLQTGRRIRISLPSHLEHLGIGSGCVGKQDSTPDIPHSII